MELSQYEICYLSQAAIKGQVVVDFIVELTPNEENKMLPKSSSLAIESMAVTRDPRVTTDAELASS